MFLNIFFLHKPFFLTQERRRKNYQKKFVKLVSGYLLIVCSILMNKSVTSCNLVVFSLSWVSDSPVSAENVIYETSVEMRKLRWHFSALLSWGKHKNGDMSLLHHSKLLFTFPFLQESIGVKHYPISPIKTKAS